MGGLGRHEQGKLTVLVRSPIRYIAPEQVPVQYGGMYREGEKEFTTANPVTEISINPAAKHTVEFHVTGVSFTCVILSSLKRCWG